MPKLILSIALLILVISYSIAQNTDVMVGPEFEVPKNGTLSEIIGSDNSGFYVLISHYKGFKNLLTIARFNPSMEFTQQKLLQPTQNGKELKVDRILQLGDKIYLFTSLIEQEKGRRYLNVQTLNKSNLTPVDDFKKIDEAEFDPRYQSPDFTIELSPDSSKILISKNLVALDKNLRYSLKVYDASFNLINAKEVTPYVDLVRFDKIASGVSNDGHSFLLGEIHPPVVKGEKETGEHIMHATICKKDGSVKEFSFALGEKIVTDAKLATHNDQLILAGFYSKLNTWSVAGVFIINIDLKTEVITSEKFIDFSVDFFTKYTSEKKSEQIEKDLKEQRPVEMFELKLEDLIFSGSSFSLIGEQEFYKSTERSYTASDGSTKTRTLKTYYYEDIIVANISTGGSMNWVERIPKLQVSQGDAGFYSSYVHAYYNDKLYFFFNDHKDNLETWSTDKGKDFTFGENGIVNTVILDKNGNQKREMLYKTQDVETVAVPRLSRQVSQNSLIMYAQKKKKNQFIKVGFRTN